MENIFVQFCEFSQKTLFSVFVAHRYPIDLRKPINKSFVRMCKRFIQIEELNNEIFFLRKNRFKNEFDCWAKLYDIQGEQKENLYHILEERFSVYEREIIAYLKKH